MVTAASGLQSPTWDAITRSLRLLEPGKKLTAKAKRISDPTQWEVKRLKEGFVWTASACVHADQIRELRKKGAEELKKTPKIGTASLAKRFLNGVFVPSAYPPEVSVIYEEIKKLETADPFTPIKRVCRARIRFLTGRVERADMALVGELQGFLQRVGYQLSDFSIR